MAPTAGNLARPDAGLCHRHAVIGGGIAYRPDQRQKITWLPNPDEAKATEIAIFIAKPDKKFEADCWPGKQSMGTSLIGSFPLANGETVWAVWRHMPLPKFETAGPGVGQFYKN